MPWKPRNVPTRTTRPCCSTRRRLIAAKRRFPKIPTWRNADPDEEIPGIAARKGGLSGFWSAFKEKLTRLPAPQSEPVDTCQQKPGFDQRKRRVTPLREALNCRGQRHRVPGKRDEVFVGATGWSPCDKKAVGAFLLSAFRQKNTEKRQTGMSAPPSYAILHGLDKPLYGRGDDG